MIVATRSARYSAASGSDRATRPVAVLPEEWVASSTASHPSQSASRQLSALADWSRSIRILHADTKQEQQFDAAGSPISTRPIAFSKRMGTLLVAGLPSNEEPDRADPVIQSPKSENQIGETYASDHFGQNFRRVFSCEQRGHFASSAPTGAV